MTRVSEEFERSTIGFRTIVALTALFIVLQCGTVLTAQEQPGASAFKTSCASCHGQNGAPTAVGKSLNAPDLGSTTVQNHTDAELQQIIADGKGNMPPFKGRLSDDQINSLVAHIRTFAAQRK
jgi:cytochrome c6